HRSDHRHPRTTGSRLRLRGSLGVAVTRIREHAATPATTTTEEILMRAVTLDAFDAAPAVRDDLPDPIAAADELVVRVRASSVNPVDNAIAVGMLREMADHDFPVVLGRDYAGTVEALGAGLDGYAVGDEVFGFLLHANPTVHEGSWAELIALTPEIQVAPK